MAETPKPETPKADDSKISLGDIRKMVTDTIAEAMKGVNKTEDTAHDKAQDHTLSKLDRSSTIQAAVQAEIDKIKARETEEAEKKTLQDKLAELSEKTKEKPPVERSRTHKFMGWGE